MFPNQEKEENDWQNIIFYSIGTHENFYRDLKRYLKEIEKSDYSWKRI
jgi:hypothetical protein